MTTPATWLLVAALAVVFALVVARSEWVRRRRGVSAERRRALVVLQSGSALFVLTMLTFERAFGLLPPLDVHPVVHVVLLLASMCCVMYGYIRYVRSKRTTATAG
ncbi:hypothetical protein [Haloarchaeobius salinus]|uniref:hypothetical protein n=1 Tax=Haloarchaeobius salinus TaxID=1198298 RepID=UPI00210D5D11|nr:hypothetical protein [Haloarchaeobius salinus]